MDKQQIISRPSESFDALHLTVKYGVVTGKSSVAPTGCFLMTRPVCYAGCRMGFQVGASGRSGAREPRSVLGTGAPTPGQLGPLRWNRHPAAMPSHASCQGCTGRPCAGVASTVSPPGPPALGPLWAALWLLEPLLPQADSCLPCFLTSTSVSSVEMAPFPRCRVTIGHRPGWPHVLPALPAGCDHLGTFRKARVSWARLRLFCPDTGTSVSQGPPPPPVAPDRPGELTALGPVGSGCAKPTPTMRLVSVCPAPVPQHRAPVRLSLPASAL